MKNKKILIIIFVCILSGLLGVSMLYYNNLDNTDEIEDYIMFKTANYKSVEGVVYYNNDEVNLDDTLRENFVIIAKKLKEQYPNKSILFLRDLGSAQLFDAKVMYRCMQIQNGQKLDNTEMNVLVKNDGDVEFDFLIDSYWSSDNEIKNLKITQDEAKEIVIKHLRENPGDYEQLQGWGGLAVEKEICTIELYKYNAKDAWKMQFLTGGSYMIIDANTGEILDKNFFCGVIVG